MLVIFGLSIVMAVYKMNAQVKIGDNPKRINPNALLELESKNQGFLLPRLTAAQRNIAFGTDLPDGLVIYNTDKGAIEVFSENKGWNILSTSDLPNLKLELTNDHQLILNDKLRVNLTHYYNENQQLTLSGNILSLTNGGRVDLSSLTISSTNSDIQGPPGSSDSSESVSSNTDSQTLSVLLDGNQLKFNLLNSGQGIQVIDLSGLLGKSAFSTQNNVTNNSSGDVNNDDFVFGSDQLENKTGGDDDTRMIFDKSKGAFRAGRDGKGSWNESKRGEYSVGLGYNTEAKADRSVALGNSLTASAYAETVLGSYNEIFSGASINSWEENDPLLTIGNGTSSSKKKTALTVLKNGNLGIGTKTPVETLEVVGSVSATAFYGNTMILNEGGTFVTGKTGLFASVSNTITELVAFDSAGNESTISPHNFSLIGSPSEAMAWSFYSKNNQINKQVNVDMMQVVRLVERLTGQKLVHLADMNGKEIENHSPVKVTQMEIEIERLKVENQVYQKTLKNLLNRLDALERKIH